MANKQIGVPPIGIYEAFIEAEGEVIEKPKAGIFLSKKESWFQRRRRFEDTKPWAVKKQG